ncbi:GntR family transcriptional regulator [Lentzea sp. NBRC 102530]|uniref:GntR family transcriptional regulator n=1 Tax=Lentzea sp. NBRC 102530 TaxID=3032201 RepID=UPI0025566B67|nr:GntR family transcriptional regulator [Lentzea sp. NBRC 102530]
MPPPAVRPVARRGVAGEAADRIRDAILAGELAAGTALKEVELASVLGVSRGSVREGLVVLESEGLVVSEWHRGTWVRELTPDDVDELYTLRTALDVLAMRTAAAKGSGFGPIDEVVRAMEHARTDTERVALDMEFHDAVYAATGHRRLQEAWRAIRCQVHLFLLARVADDPTYQELVVPEHAGLAAVLRAGDPGAAGCAAEEHLRGSSVKLVEKR